MAALLPTLTGVSQVSTNSSSQYAFATMAGDPTLANDDGLGAAARFDAPTALATDAGGNLYVADAGLHTIRKVTPTGLVTTLAGLANVRGCLDGAGSGALFYGPHGIAVDGAGNMYVADTYNAEIRKITPDGVVTTLAGKSNSNLESVDGVGSVARFARPRAVAVDSAGILYVMDSYFPSIRRITPDGAVTTLTFLNDAGAIPQVSSPIALAIDAVGNMYFTDSYYNMVRKRTPNGELSILAGDPRNSGGADGSGSAARFYGPQGLAVDSTGNVYVTDAGNNSIRRIKPSGEVTTVAGQAGAVGNSDGIGKSARFNNPRGLVVDVEGNIYIADTGNREIRRIASDDSVVTVAGFGGAFANADGMSRFARFYHPSSLSVDGDGNVFIADSYNHTIRKMTSAGFVSTVAGAAGNPGSADGAGATARFNSPRALAVDRKGTVYIADTGNNAIRFVTPDGVVSTLSGLTNGGGVTVHFHSPTGVAVDAKGNLYVADNSYSTAFTVVKVTPDGAALQFSGFFNRDLPENSYPTGIAVDNVGNVYVGDIAANLVWKITPVGVPTVLAGQSIFGPVTGANLGAPFYYPQGLALDRAGNLYIADAGNNTILRLSPAGNATTIGGIPGNPLSVDGRGAAARFDVPTGLTIDGNGDLYVADAASGLIRKSSASGTPQTIPVALSGIGAQFSNGAFGFELSGPAGGLAVIDASSDLQSWLPIWTNTFRGPASYGIFTFSDAQNSRFPIRFYRARTP